MTSLAEVINSLVGVTNGLSSPTLPVVSRRPAGCGECRLPVGDVIYQVRMGDGRTKHGRARSRWSRTAAFSGGRGCASRGSPVCWRCVVCRQLGRLRCHTLPARLSVLVGVDGKFRFDPTRMGNVLKNRSLVLLKRGAGCEWVSE